MQKRKLGNLEVTELGNLREIESGFLQISVQGARLSEAHMQLIDRQSSKES